MKPLPKWAGWLGVLITALAAGWTVYQSNGDVAAAASAVVGAVIAAFAHSIPGTGGTPSK